MLLFSFLFGMVGGWVVHILFRTLQGDNARLASRQIGCAVGKVSECTSEKHNSSEKSLSEKPEWEEVRKIPGRIFWTIALPLFVMAIVSKDADLVGSLILICMVIYAVFRFSFSVAGEFLPWGPEGSIVAKKRMIRAAKLYLQARTWEKKEPVSLRIEEVNQPKPIFEGMDHSVRTFRTLFDSEKEDLCRHWMTYGRTANGMTQNPDRIGEVIAQNARVRVRIPYEESDLPNTEEFQCCLCHPDPENEFHRYFRREIQKYGEKGRVIFALSDLDQLIAGDISEERKAELKAENAEYRRQYKGNVDALLGCPANHVAKTSGEKR